MAKVKTARCIFIPANPALPVIVAENSPTDLASLQKLVGGYIELVRCHPARLASFALALGTELQRGAALFVNETGRLEGLPLNERASLLHADPMGILGDAFIMAVP